MHLAASLAASAQATPDAVAVRLGDRALTYGQLDRRVDAAASALQRAGVRPGDRVALLLGNRPAFVEALYAAARAGAVVVPVHTGLTAPEVAHELTDARARAAVVGAAHVEVLEALRGRLPDLDAVWVEGPGPADLRPWEDEVAAGVAAEARADPVEPGDDDLALLAYTSGTAGMPKGAMLTHGQLLANHRQLRAAGLGVRPGEVVLAALPLFHIYGLNVALAPTLADGGTVELLERFDPADSLALVERRRVGVVVGVPPMYVAWLAARAGAGADGPRPDLSSVRLATSGAAPLDPELLRRCADELGLDVREGYGLTEAAPVVTTTASLPAAVPGSVGEPLEGIELRIVEDDPGAPTPVEDGDVGIVHVRGPNVFSGYWEQPEVTAAVLLDGGWLDTGDVGYLDGRGLLHLVDRAKDLVIVSGFNVYPAEVEAVLLSHPAVAQAAVVGVPHPATGEAVRAVVVLHAGASATPEELIAHTEGRLARYKRPSTVDLVPALPTLPTGKVRRRLLRSP
jgi:long-chain acyl-CoA synthetase